MDHLSQPATSFQPLNVPYFEGPPFSPPFDTFPERHGCEVRGGQHHPSLHASDPAKLIEILQSWLLFGLLEDFLDSAGVKFQLDQFLSENREYRLERSTLIEGPRDGDVRHMDSEVSQPPISYHEGVVRLSTSRQLVSTSQLWRYLNEAIGNLKEIPASELEQALKRLESRLAVSYSVIHDLEHRFPSAIVHSHSTSTAQAKVEDSFLTVFLAIQALRQALIQTKLILEGKSRGMEMTHGSKLLARRMTRQGWCPYQAAWVAKSFSPISGYYIALLGPTLPLKCHIGCNNRHCRLLQIDNSSYQTKHRLDCDESCHMVAPDMDKLCSILVDGGLPLLLIRGHKNGEYDSSLQVEVKRWENKGDFYAISHVWSDGMGNPRQNALPACQLSFLASVASEAHRAKGGPPTKEPSEDEDSIAIWLDTICVPLEPRARKFAISGMKNAYVHATQVIVFDAALQQVRLQDTSFLEQGYRILTSNWHRRLWTLQEAVFAPKLTFKLEDGLLFFEDFLALSKQEDDPGHPPDFSLAEMRSGLDYFCSGQYRAELISLDRVNQTARVDRFIKTMEHFCHRTTSRMSDEAICLATLLDGDISDILEADESDRLHYVLEHQRGFSPHVIFLPGPKMQKEPFRWAPATFMYPWNSVQRQCFVPPQLKNRNAEYVSTSKLATVTPQGLLLDLPGIIVGAPKSRDISGTDFFLADEAGEARRILHLSTVPEDGSDSGGPQPILTFKPDEDASAAEAAETNGTLNATYAILLIGFVGAPMDGYKDLAPTHILGLVISGLEQANMEVSGQRTEVLVGRCETRVSIRETEHNPHLFEKHGRKVLDESGNIKGIDISGKCLRGRAVEDCLIKWCIR